MVIPAIVAGVFCLGLLFFIFRHQIPDQLQIPEQKASDAIKDRPGAIFGSIWMIICLILLIANTWTGMKLWQMYFPNLLTSSPLQLPLLWCRHDGARPREGCL
jgi:Na+/H+ antiporter NhaD/arsenite permease-like protein